MAALRCFRAIVRGRVQGVSFRYYALLEAEQLGVLGYVKNRWDGTVEVVAEGEDDAVRKLLAWLYHGPRWARVEGVEVEWMDATGAFERFEVRF